MYGEVCLSGMRAEVRRDGDIHASTAPQKLFCTLPRRRVACEVQANNPPAVAECLGDPVLDVRVARRHLRGLFAGVSFEGWIRADVEGEPRRH